MTDSSNQAVVTTATAVESKKTNQETKQEDGDASITLLWRTICPHNKHGAMVETVFKKGDGLWPFAKFLVDNRKFYRKLLFGTALGVYQEMHLVVSEKTEAAVCKPTKEQGSAMMRAARQMMVEMLDYGRVAFVFGAFANIADDESGLSVGRNISSCDSL